MNYQLLAVAKGSVPVNEPLQSMPVGTKPNYSGSIQSGSFADPVKEDNTSEAIMPTPLSVSVEVDRSHNFALYMLVGFAVLLVFVFVLYKFQKTKS